MSLPEGDISTLVIAAPRSGAGKTSVAVGIMAYLRSKGYRVQGFKVGPDYLDPMYHRLASGRPSRNLDIYLMPDDAVFETFWRGVETADVAVVEGVMGLYDGRLEGPPSASTAEVAKLLDLPVLLVMDVAGQAQTASAMLLGLMSYPGAPKLLGVILNRVGSHRHAEAIGREIQGTTGVPVLGAIPRESLPHLPERHLGLVPVTELSTAEEAVAMLGEAIGRLVDVEGLIRLFRRPRQKIQKEDPPPVPRCTLAVARDAAFNFYYEDNLDLLVKVGARLLGFSPISDRQIPVGANGIYLGGGYPELFGAELSQNESMLRSIRAAAADGMPIYAECGGLMYLCQGIEAADGRRFPMVGLVNAWAKMGASKARLAYVEVEVDTPSWLGPAGQRWRGHEYHWSALTAELQPPLYRYLAPYTGYQGVVCGPSRNVVASYVHLHFASLPELAHRFVEACLGDRQVG
jgi:cobyrinic acid a,c-diamide synthase